MHNNQNPPETQQEKRPSEVFGLAEAPPANRHENSEPEQRTTVERLLDLAGCCEFWHTPSGVPLVSLPCSGHREHYRVDSSAFKEWLLHRIFESTGRGVSTESMKQAVSTLSARAKFAGDTHDAFLRVAEDHDGNFWLDLSDDQWRAVKVTTAGWEVINDPPVRFLRHPGMRPIPVPLAGKIDSLWSLIQCAPEDRSIVVGYLLNALHPSGPYFGLNLFGSKGSAKSTATRILRSLIDPNEAFSQSMPRSGEDLALSAQTQRILAFENLSKLSEAESDWLCRLSTGDAIRRRTLYADSDETIFRAKRPWIINGIPNLVSRGDLIDRALSVELPPIDRSERREESQILESFERATPEILGALLDGVSRALATLHEVRLKYSGDLPRMADVALWITAAEPALGFEQGEFLKRQREIALDSSADAAEGNVVAATILRLAGENKVWEGQMKDLLTKIENDHPDDRFLPQSPRALGNAINRLKTDLWEAYRVRVEKLPRKAGGIPVRIAKKVHDLHNLNELKFPKVGSNAGSPESSAQVQTDVHSEIPDHSSACV